MNTGTREGSEFEREKEQLRQERETFKQHSAHATRWSTLRLVMGYSSIALMTLIMFGAFYILLDSFAFPGRVVSCACGALFADVLGLLITIWKMVMNGSQPALSPVTTSNKPRQRPTAEPEA